MNVLNFFFANFAWYRKMVGGVWYCWRYRIDMNAYVRWQQYAYPDGVGEPTLVRTEVYGNSEFAPQLWQNMVFFLGGHDAEMSEIARIAHAAGIKVFDKGLGWGAKLSDYADEIETFRCSGKMLVFVELEGAMEFVRQNTDFGCNIQVVDHHNQFSGSPASILQVCELVRVKPNWWQQALAINDVAWIPGMQRAGIDTRVQAEIRKLDRAEQGITYAQELEAEQAVRTAEFLSNGVVVARLSHSKFAPVKDRLVLAGFTQIVSYCTTDGETEFQGDGVIVQRVHQKFGEGKGGWCGGQVGVHGGSAFAGFYTQDLNEVLTFVQA